MAVNGVNYGITSAGDDTSVGNAAVTGQFPLIQNAVVFTLSYSGDLDLNDISNVNFQYGTSLSDFNTPDGGATITLLGLALAGIGLVSRRRK